MKKTIGLEKLIPRTRLAFVTGIAVALGVLAATIVSGVLFVRSQVREQIIRRDAEALYATTLMEQLDDASPSGNEFRSDEQIGFDAAIRASRLKGVIGIRFYDAEGAFTDTFPATILPNPLGRSALEDARAMIPNSRFLPSAPLSSIFIYLPQFATGRIERTPILEVTVPLHRRSTENFSGVAQFIIEGASIATEYEQLDRRLVQISVATFVIAGLLMASMLWLAFRGLERMNIDLAVRGERLKRANEELALAARSSAVGAISAHLMHGLKNPLSSLSQFVSSRRDGGMEPDEGDWQDALTAAYRMQTLVGQTMEVLGDVSGAPVYEMAMDELLDELKARVAASANRRNIALSIEAEGRCTLSSHTANLAGLVLTNLLENAIEETPSGGAVSLRAERGDENIRFYVQDGGNGFPDQLRDQLFLPCKSTRDGGSGIGLAISKLIADHLGARLVLEESTPNGCLFLLELPLAVCQ